MATTSVAPAAVARGAVASTRGRVARAARANRRAAPRLADSSQRTRIPGTRRLRAGANAARSSIRCRASSSDGADDKIEDLLALVRAARVSREDADAAEDEEETEAAAAEAISRGSSSSSSSELEAKLAEAESENERLREKVAELTAENEDAMMELLEDATELAEAVARAEDLELEAEELRTLNDALATAAEEVAALARAGAGAGDAAEELRALKTEAAAAKSALAVAETRAKENKNALLAKIRALEVDLAEAEGGLAHGAADGAAGEEFATAKRTIETLTALAAERAEKLAAAEAAAAAAASEADQLKRQLSKFANIGATPPPLPMMKDLKRVRELEAMMAEMLTPEEAHELESKIRALEATVAEMADVEELDAAEGARDTLLSRVRELEIMIADMVDVSELEGAEARAKALEAEADAMEAKAEALRKKIRALESTMKGKVRTLELEMAEMSYDDEVGEVAPLPSDPRKRGGAFTMRKFNFNEGKKEAAPAAAAAAKPAADGKAFERSGGFTLRRFDFAAMKTVNETPVVDDAVANAASAQLWIDAWSDAMNAKTAAASKGAFKRAPREAFTLRKLNFNYTEPVAVAFKRTDNFTLRRFNFVKDPEELESEPKYEQAVTYSFGDAPFKRAAPGNFQLRRFDFLKASAVNVKYANDYKKNKNAFNKRKGGSGPRRV